MSGQADLQREKRSVTASLVLLVLLLAAAPATAQLTATWTGAGGDNNYSNANNWSTLQAPINDLSDTYEVVIPGGVTVLYDVAGAGNQVDGLSLAGGSTLVMGSPSLALEVIGATSIAGTINADDGSLTAASLASSLTGTPHLVASGGGTIRVAAPSFSATYSGAQVIFDVDGAGSAIVLDTVDSLVANESTVFTDPLMIRATNSGVINLSAVESASSNDRLDFVIGSGGDIDLSSLLSTSSVRFQVDKASYSLPALSSAASTTFDVASGTAFNSPLLGSMTGSTVTLADGGALIASALTSFQSSSITLTPTRTFTTAGLVNIDSSRFYLQAGAVFDQVTATNYTGSFSGAQMIMESDGVGSDLDLSSLTSLSVDENSSFEDVITIRASSGGLVDFSNIATIQANDLLALEVRSSGDIDLRSLISTQRVLFDIDVATYTAPLLATATGTRYDVGPAATLNLPMLTQHDGGSVTLAADATLNAESLTNLNNVTISAAQDATLNAPLLTDFAGSVATLSPDITFTTGSLSNIDNARLFIEGGKVFNAVTASSYTANLSSGAQTLFQAGGSGSLLDLSSLTSIEANELSSFEDPLTVRALNNGVIDLSSVESAMGSDLLVFEATSGGQIDLSSLISVSRVLFDVDVTSFDLPSLATAAASRFQISTGAAVNAPNLSSVSGAIISVSDGGALNAPNLTSLTTSLATFTASNSIQTAGLVNIDGSRFFVEADAVFDSVTAPGYQATFSGSQTIMQAIGVGAVLDLSTLKSFVVTENSSFDDPITVRGADQALIDLSSVVTASSNDRLRFVADGGGRIDLGGLQSASRIDFEVASGGQIEVGSVSPGDSVNISVTDSNSRFTVLGDLLVDPSSTISLGSGGEMTLRGDYRFEQTVVSNLALDSGVARFEGLGGQQMEVGGLDSGAGGATSGNFGMGRLVIGTTTERTSVELIDAIDNGNRGVGGEAEALYLYGLGGPTGLHILNDSALVLNGLNVYAWDPIEGQQVHLNSLFGPGELRIPYDNGFLQLVPLDFQWDSNEGGDFNLGSNWSDGQTPLGSDAAIWNLGSVGGYIVQLGTNVATDSAIIKTDRVTFDLGGFTYASAGLHATDSLVVAQSPTDNGVLTVVNGTLAASSARVAPAAGSTGQLTIAATGELDIAGDLILGGGSATMTVQANGAATVGGELLLGDNSTLNGSGTVNGDVNNQSGTVSPGESVGILAVVGSLTQGANGTITIELGGDDNSDALNPQYDQLVVDGVMATAGALNVSLLDLGGGLFNPELGDTFEVITKSLDTRQAFDTVALPGLDAGLVWRLVDASGAFTLLVGSDLAGDYNGDARVDAADYTVWRDALGQQITVGAGADGDNSGAVDQGDYEVWRTNYGMTALAASAAGATVPSPSGLCVLSVALSLLAIGRGRDLGGT